MALLVPFQGKWPQVDPSAFVAENATLIGDVTVGPDASIWYGCVLRGDVGAIRVGARSNVQDLSCVHVTEHLSSTIVGDDVTVGHSVILHGCIVGHGCLIGMGSILLDNARVEDGAVVGAGSLVTSGTVIAAGHMAMGRPAKAVRALRPEEASMGREGAAHYVDVVRRYRAPS